MLALPRSRVLGVPRTRLQALFPCRLGLNIIARGRDEAGFGTSSKVDDDTFVSTVSDQGSVDDLLEKEWLLTNDRGGYSSSTVLGCNTRSYHGILTGSLDPPVNRITALSNCHETVTIDGEEHILSVVEFSQKVADDGWRYLRQFRQDGGVHFDYQIGKVALRKSIYLMRDADVAAIVYDFSRVREPVEFSVRPFTALRDFHHVEKGDSRFRQRTEDGGVLVEHADGGCQLLLKCETMDFEGDEQWWYDFLYRVNRDRGQDCVENLWSPGVFRCPVQGSMQVVLWACLSRRFEEGFTEELDIDAVRKDVRKHQREIAGRGKGRDERLRRLFLAADNFVVRRTVEGRPESTIVAGYPWFADWGRDAFIALPGLLLATGRLDEARSVLTTFAAAADHGMIPNRFDDRCQMAHFNSVDASLWFIDAAFEYLRVSRDTRTFMRELLPVIRWVVDSYQNGTLYDIHADGDGLISAGDEQTQLTWMDAKCGGVAFTPRWGKAVEVNALWHNALMLLAELYNGRNLENSRSFKAMAEKVAKSFAAKFWNSKLHRLNDCVRDDYVDSSMRPNQIFAVSLRHSLLSKDKQWAVVDAVEGRLLTPYGLRTLDSTDPRYRGRYEGPMMERDAAYHQGTVWPFLMGPFIEAYLKVNDYSREAKKRAAAYIEPLLRHLTDEGCLGSVSEVFDGDEPQKPKGCFAQAWSVASLIKAYTAVKS